MTPLAEYRRASKEEARLRRLADAYASERAAVLAEMHIGGMSYGQIAVMTGLSRSRVQQLVQRYQTSLLSGDVLFDDDRHR